MTEAVLGLAGFFGYCLFYASWLGLGAAVFAIAWRWCGAWIIILLVGAVIGAVATVMLAAVIFHEWDLPSAGPHGGGDIAALLVIGVYLVSAVIGAIGGGVLLGVPALIVGWNKRRRRQTNADIPKLK